jgi:hypothetical protein
VEVRRSRIVDCPFDAQVAVARTLGVHATDGGETRSSARRTATVARVARCVSVSFRSCASYPPSAASSLWRRTWVCASMSPGSTVAPERSMTRAPSGIFRAPASPTLSTRLPRTTIIWFGFGAEDTPSIKLRLG